MLKIKNNFDYSPFVCELMALRLPPKKELTPVSLFTTVLGLRGMGTASAKLEQAFI